MTETEMTETEKQFGLHATTWRTLGIAIMLTCGFIISYATAVLLGIVTPKVPEGAPLDIIDFQIFHLVGQMIWDGQLAQAYDFPTLHAIQVARTGSTDFMTWSYPPQFDLVVAVLGLLPRALSYFLFTTLTLAGFLFVLRKLAGSYNAAVLAAIAPSLFIAARSGQNGFLTGGLIGLFCLLMLQRKTLAGLPLGLLIIKPHLAVGISALVLVTRSWKIIALGAVVVALSFAAATLAFGPGIWRTFLDGAAQTSGFLWQEYFPAFYMTSAFAVVSSFGFSTGTAMKVQIAVAIIALIVIVAVHRARAPRRVQVGVAVLVSVIISPYNYGYDLPMLGVALALLFPIVDRSGIGVEKAAVFVLAWTATGWGALRNSMRLAQSENHATYGADPVPSLAGIAIFILVLIILNIVRRELAPRRIAAQLRPGM